MRVLLPLIAALVPLIIAPELSFYFDITPKAVALLTGMALALILWSGELPRAGTARTVAFLLIAEIAWLALATAFSSNPAVSFSGGAWRRFGFMTHAAVLGFAVMVISDCAGRPERAMSYLRVVALAGLPIAFYGILQHFGMDPWLASIAYRAGEGPFMIVRPPSTLGHASYFGTYLLYVVFAGVALVLASERRAWRAVGVCAILAASAAILFSGTRAAIAGVAVGAVLLLIRVPSLRSKAALAGGLITVTALLGFVISPAGAGIRSRIHWSLEEPLGGARPLLWRDSLRMAATHPGAGYGPETFTAEFPRYQSVALSRAYPDFQHESPHNLLLDTLLEQGVPGLLLFCAVVGIVLVAGISWERRVCCSGGSVGGPGGGAGSAAVQRAHDFDGAAAVPDGGAGGGVGCSRGSAEADGRVAASVVGDSGTGDADICSAAGGG